MNWIKEKLTAAGRWIKAKVRWILVALGIIGIASAAILMPNGEIPTTIIMGEIQRFPYTDENSNESLPIWTNQENYYPLWAWNGFDVLVAMGNESANQNISFQSFFSKDFIIESISILDPNATATFQRSVYEEVCEEVVATTTGEIVTDCQSRLTGMEDVTLRGIWNLVEQKQFSKKNYDRLILEKNIPIKQKSGNKVRGHFTIYSEKDTFTYFKLRVKANEPFGEEEFDLEAIGEKGGYGLLDPTILTDDFNSYNDGDLNTQGSWSGHASYDVQGTTVKEGAKAVKYAGPVAGQQVMAKTGTIRAAGNAGMYMRHDGDASTDTGGYVLREGGAWKAYTSFDIVNRVIKLHGGSAIDLLTSISTTTWYWVEIEWTDTPSQQIKGRVNAGAWSATTTPVSSWSSGLDEVAFWRNTIADGDVFYWDYIAQEAFTPPADAPLIDVIRFQ